MFEGFYLSSLLFTIEFLVLSFPPILVFGPSVLPSSPLVSAVGWSQLKPFQTAGGAIPAFLHPHPPTHPCSLCSLLSLSPEHSLPYPTHPSAIEGDTHRDREEGKQRHSGRLGGREKDVDFQGSLICYSTEYFDKIPSAHLTHR